MGRESMKRMWICKIKIDKVRNINNIEILLDENERKHLIITGKNGSGKTSILEAIKSYISVYASSDANNRINIKQNLQNVKQQLELEEKKETKNSVAIQGIEQNLKYYTNVCEQYYKGLELEFTSEQDVIAEFQSGNFIVAFYGADRVYHAEEARHVEKINFKDKYEITDEPGKQLIKYLLDLKTTSALTEISGKLERAKAIKEWFEEFEKMLKVMFDDESVILDFDIDYFTFAIKQKGHEPFGFNQLSSGYAAIVNIVADIMMRMEKNNTRIYNAQGIVLIDEIETHLHLDMQKRILPFLTNIFPQIQFIITTHSPFILTSIDNAVIYDLEKRNLVEDLSAYSYEGIVEYYFNADMYSDEVKSKFERYKALLEMINKNEDEMEEFAGIVTYLQQIPAKASEELVYAFRELELKRKSKQSVEEI